MSEQVKSTEDEAQQAGAGHAARGIENAPPASEGAAARAELEARWLILTRELLPSLAQQRGFPVRADHCFQRILLDTVCGGRWYDHVQGRPAYRHLAEDKLAQAVGLAEAVARGEVDLVPLNRRSIAARRA